MAVSAITARIAGRVQGVGFRAWTQAEAEHLGLDGWVRNEPDGTVSVCLGGAPSVIDAMVERLHRGPPAAKVDRVETDTADPPAAGFAILR